MHNCRIGSDGRFCLLRYCWVCCWSAFCPKLTEGLYFPTLPRPSQRGFFMPKIGGATKVQMLASSQLLTWVALISLCPRPLFRLLLSVLCLYPCFFFKPLLFLII